MASTKTDLSRGTYSHSAFHDAISINQSSAKAPEADLNALLSEQQNDSRRFVVVYNSSGEVIKREIPFSVKQELQRTFYEQINKLLE